MALYGHQGAASVKPVDSKEGGLSPYPQPDSGPSNSQELLPTPAWSLRAEPP